MILTKLLCHFINILLDIDHIQIYILKMKNIINALQSSNILLCIRLKMQPLKYQNFIYLRIIAHFWNHYYILM